MAGETNVDEIIPGRYTKERILDALKEYLL